jgi:carbamoyl-phosphate synthase large subunit
VGLVYDAQESGIYAEDRPDVVYTIPYPSSGQKVLLNRLLEIHALVPYDVLLPTLDAEIEPLLHLDVELRQRGIIPILPEDTSFHTRSKQNLTDLCQQCDVRTPATEVVADVASVANAIMEVGFPAFVKGPYYDAHRVFGMEDLVARSRALFAEWGGPLLVQEALEGAEYNVLAVGDGLGGVMASCSVRKTVLSSKGKGYGEVTVSDPVLDAQCARLIQYLKWRGPLELEFLRDQATGDYCLLEINPRFPAWADVPALLGVNMAEMVVRQAMGEAVDAVDACSAGQFFLRHNVDLVGSIEDFGQLLTQGTLEL